MVAGQVVIEFDLAEDMLLPGEPLKSDEHCSKVVSGIPSEAFSEDLIDCADGPLMGRGGVALPGGGDHVLRGHAVEHPVAGHQDEVVLGRDLEGSDVRLRDEHPGAATLA
jgi:hypothetical protein